MLFYICPCLVVSMQVPPLVPQNPRENRNYNRIRNHNSQRRKHMSFLNRKLRKTEKTCRLVKQTSRILNCTKDLRIYKIIKSINIFIGFKQNGEHGTKVVCVMLDTRPQRQVCIVPAILKQLSLPSTSF